MQPFIVHHGRVAAIRRANIDTDQIIPKQFLKRIERTGFGPFLFHDWRYLTDGRENPKFELNREQFRGATLLLAGANFGCGSSREHAPWALADFGFRAVVAASFADIFRSNALNNGLLPVSLGAEQHRSLLATLAEHPHTPITIDLTRRTLSVPWAAPWSFPVDPFARQCLLQGVDPLGYVLAADAEIAAH